MITVDERAQNVVDAFGEIENEVLLRWLVTEAISGAVQDEREACALLVDAVAESVRGKGTNQHDALSVSLYGSIVSMLQSLAAQMRGRA